MSDFCGEMVSTFNFNGTPVRITKDESGEPWFVAKDVGEILELGNPRSSLALLDEDEKGVHIIDTPSGAQEMSIVSEAGLYSLVLRSRKPEAKAFKRWVTHEVLPAIRRDGGYMVAKPEETPEQLYQRCMTMLNHTIERQKAQIAAQDAQLKLQAPDVDYCRTVLASSTLMTSNTIATHIGVSAKRLNAFLGGEGWIYRQGRNWCPSFKIRDRGYCDYETIPYTNRAGDGCTAYHLKWTESGRRAVIELWNKRHNTAISSEAM